MKAGLAFGSQYTCPYDYRGYGCSGSSQSGHQHPCLYESLKTYERRPTGKLMNVAAEGAKCWKKFEPMVG